jgi:hypothetical protein
MKEKTKSPRSPVTMSHTALVASLVSFTGALGTGAPEGS